MESNYPARVIDVHCHLFNARYLPLKGVLESLGVPAWLAGPARDLLNSLTETADAIPYASTSFFAAVPTTDEVPQLANALSEFVAADLSRRIVASDHLFVADGSPRSRGAVESSLRRDALYASLEHIRGLRLRDMKVADAASRATGVPELLSRVQEETTQVDGDVSAVTQSWALSFFSLDLDWLMELLFEFIEAKLGAAALGYIKFLLFMLSSEEKLLEELLSSYRPEQNVDLSVHLMMDMQEGYSGEVPHYPFDTEQIDRMAAIVGQANGAVAGFVAFDPRRDNGLALVQYGLENGNSGVKLYPPMGYVATGETAEEQARFTALHAYCDEHRVPILVHCSPVGFEAYDGAGVKSSPEHWNAVLEEFPGLILCYGHAGGDMATNLDPDTGQEETYPGWFVDPAQWDDPRNFSKMVVAHCRQYEHVYCDFSYLHEATNDAGLAANFKANLIRELEASDGSYALGDKIMYGADWHMPSMTAAVDEFLDFMIELFNDPELQPYKDRFFYENAVRFL